MSKQYSSSLGTFSNSVPSYQNHSIKRSLRFPLANNTEEPHKEVLLGDYPLIDGSTISSKAHLSKLKYSAYKSSLKITNFVSRRMSYDFLVKKSQQTQMEDETQLLQYLDANRSLLDPGDVPFIVQELKQQRKLNFFLSDILNSSPLLIVHQLIFIALRAVQLYRNLPFSPTHQEELMRIVESNEWIAMVCGRQQLIILYCRPVSEELLDERERRIEAQVIEFLKFYMKAVLSLVFPIRKKVLKTKYKIIRKRNKQNTQTT